VNRDADATWTEPDHRMSGLGILLMRSVRPATGLAVSRVVSLRPLEAPTRQRCSYQRAFMTSTFTHRDEVRLRFDPRSVRLWSLRRSLLIDKPRTSELIASVPPGRSPARRRSSVYYSSGAVSKGCWLLIGPCRRRHRA